jgi:hypothetical protein
MYTEFIFQGETKPNLPDEVYVMLDYFFNECSADLIEDIKTPDHPFFKCFRWNNIGHMSSFYFMPFTVRYKQNQNGINQGAYVFLRCDLKNYDNEIDLFLDWIKPYMTGYYGWKWYEEDEQPEIIKYNR